MKILLSNLDAKRHEGIDLARILAMLMVVAFHVMDEAGWRTQETGCVEVYEMLRALFVPCVDIFAIISGFVGVNRSHRLSSLVGYWIQFVFTSLAISVVLSFAYSESFGITRVVRMMAMPLTFRGNWYLTAYSLLFLFMPLIDMGLSALSRRQMLVFLFSVFPLLFLAQLVAPGDTYNLARGFSPWWLLCLYLVGAAIRLFDWTLRPCVCVIGFAGAWLLTYSCDWLFRSYPRLEALAFGKNPMHGYLSPSVFALAVLFVLYFKSFRTIRSCALSRGVKFLAPACFGVFLIHTDPLIMRQLGRLVVWMYPSTLVSAVVRIPIAVGEFVCLVAVLFFVFALVEKLRLLLFDWLHIKDRIAWFDNFVRVR